MPWTLPYCRMPAWISRRWRWWLALLLTGLAGLLVAGGIWFPERFLTVDSGPVTADVLVVLGGGLRERPERAAELYQAGAAPRILCTGFGDAEINRKWLIQAGVPAAVIELEDKSRSTRDNARFTIARLRAQQVQSAIIVTSWYHSRRGLACFEHYAPDLKFYSRPAYFGLAAKERHQQGVSGYVKMEYLKTVGYLVCYGVWPW